MIFWRFAYLYLSKCVKYKEMQRNLQNHDHRWKLRGWIDESKLDFDGLQTNPNSIYLWEQHFDKINSCFYSNPSGYFLIQKHIQHKVDFHGPHYFLSVNPSVIRLLEENMEMIDWPALSTNPLGIDLLKKNQDKIHWRCLSGNPNAIDLLEQNFDKIDWELLSKNPKAIHLIEQNMGKVSWWNLSANPAAIHILEQNQDKIVWERLCSNPSALHLIERNIDKIEGDLLSWNILSTQEWAITILEKNLDKVNWMSLCRNPAAIHLLEKNRDKTYAHHISGNPAIFELDLDFFHKRMNMIRDELIEKTWHPDRFEEWCL